MKYKLMKNMNGVLLSVMEKEEIKKYEIVFTIKENEERLLSIRKIDNKMELVFYKKGTEDSKETIQNEDLTNIGMKYVPNYLLNTYLKLIKNFK